MVEGQPPRGFSWIREGVSDKCLGLMSALQSSQRRRMKHRLSAGKAGERPAMKREEQGPPDGILWPERLWLGAEDAEVTKPPITVPPPKPEALRGQSPIAHCSQDNQLLQRASGRQESHCLPTYLTGFLVAGSLRGFGQSPALTPIQQGDRN